VARIREASVRETAAAADMVEVVSARTQLRRSGARWTGLCPFHDEKTPSFSVNPRGQALLLLRLRGGRRRDQLRPRDRAARLRAGGRVARRALPRHLEYEESSPEQDAARGRPRAVAVAARAGDRLLRALPLGVAARRGGPLVPRRPRPRRGGLPRVPLGPGARRRDPRPEGEREGLHRRRALGRGAVNRRGNDYFNGRLLFPLADAARARARVPGPEAARRTTRCAPSTSTRPRASSSARATCSTGSTARAPRSPKQERAVVVEGNTDVLALRQAGSSRSSRRWAPR
jgi:DNA primase